MLVSTSGEFVLVSTGLDQRTLHPSSWVRAQRGRRVSAEPRTQSQPGGSKSA